MSADRGSVDVAVTGGFESMTNIPYMVPKARQGMRMGHGEFLDAMFWDGLEDAYEKGQLMGHFAEATAQHFQFTREQQDDYAIRSLQRAKAANEDGSFKDEMSPFTVKTRRGETLFPRMSSHSARYLERFQACALPSPKMARSRRRTPPPSATALLPSC